MRLLAIDPGVRTGLALVVGGDLYDVRTTTHQQALEYMRDDPAGAAVVVVEVPVIYPNGRTKNPQAVAGVALKAGELMGAAWALGHTPHPIRPSDWTRVPKDVQAERTLAGCRMRGWSLPPRCSSHARDALGIALFFLRTTKSR